MLVHCLSCLEDASLLLRLVTHCLSQTGFSSLVKLAILLMIILKSVWYPRIEFLLGLVFDQSKELCFFKKKVN